ncbi:MAG: hypothetical protein M0Z59_10270 [Nitrospiraceae bacterium]|nr:hypothetical protein [Nitrospiraceae bacterium]
MRRVLSFTPVCLLVPLLVLLWASAARASGDCLICHSAMHGAVKDAKGETVQVHLDAEAFTKSVHGSLECTNCHMSFTSGPHKPPEGGTTPEVAALLPYTRLKAKVDPVALAACSQCHPGIYKEVRESIHGEGIFKKKQSDPPLCLDCHGNPHYIVAKTDPKSPVNFANVLETCGRCHNNEEVAKKYGMSGHVIEKYKESFHGKKYILGDKKVPICNTCHGAHMIMAVAAPGSPVMGQAKLATCGRCHKGATEKFVAAPVHKYIGKENPIPFYGEKLLILLVFGVFGFTVSHVILESWAEIRDNIFRKSGKGGPHD